MRVSRRASAFLPGASGFGVAPGGRPGRVIDAVRIEAAGRRHLDRIAAREVEPAVVQRARDDAARRARRSTAARTCAGSGRRPRRCPRGVCARSTSRSPRDTRAHRARAAGPRRASDRLEVRILRSPRPRRTRPARERHAADRGRWSSAADGQSASHRSTWRAGTCSERWSRSPGALPRCGRTARWSGAGARAWQTAATSASSVVTTPDQERPRRSPARTPRGCAVTMFGMSGCDQRPGLGRNRREDGRAQVRPTTIELLPRRRPRPANWSTNCGRHARGPRAGRAAPASNASRRPCPAMARPTEPPIWRKNVRLQVATPSFWNGTAFWMTIVNTDERGPDAQAR